MKRTFYVCSTACAADYQQEKRVLISCETCGGLFFVRNKTTIAAVWCCWVMCFHVFFFSSQTSTTLLIPHKNTNSIFFYTSSLKGSPKMQPQQPQTSLVCRRTSNKKKRTGWRTTDRIQFVSNVKRMGKGGMGDNISMADLSRQRKLIHTMIKHRIKGWWVMSDKQPHIPRICVIFLFQVWLQTLVVFLRLYFVVKCSFF